MWDTLAERSCKTLLRVTLLVHSCTAFLWDSLQKSTVTNWRFVRGLLHSTHQSSLQNERFARDFLKNSHFKSAKRAFRTRLPPKFTRKSPKRAFLMRLPPKVCQSLQNEQRPSGKAPRSTHIKHPRQAASRFQPLQATSMVHTSNTHKILRLPTPHLKPAQSTAPATKSDNIISC